MSRIAAIVSDILGQQDRDKILSKIAQRLPGEGQQWLRGESFGLLSKTFAGQNPNLFYEDARVSVVLDGHILNADQLDTSASCDSLRIAELYVKKGFGQTVTDVIGEVTIALFDKESNTLYLSRDRIGSKPLYYVNNADVRACASLPFALLDLPGVSRKPDQAFVARFLGLHYRLIDNEVHDSPLQDVAQLPAGCWVELKAGQEAKTVRYWALTDQGDWPATEGELAEQYRERLLKAVERRYKVAENPLFTLSGGLDSSSVLCCASEVSGEKQVAISSVYTDKTYDERDEIQDVVNERVSKWVPVELENDIDIFDYVAKMVRVHNEPVATATWLSHFQLCHEIAQKGSASLFGGLGGDELNAGEYEYFPMLFADLLQQGKMDAYDHEVTEWARHHDHPIFKKNHEVARSYLDKMTDSETPGRILHDPARMFKYAHTLNEAFFDLDGFEPVMSAPYQSYLKNRTYQDLVRETTQCCLRAEDRQCTYYGIEHFDPFLDHELVEFMFRVPGEMKIRDGITKRLLREAMKGILPEATRSRIAKTGWNAPAHMWFGGENLQRLRDMVSSAKFKERRIYSPDAILALIDEHEAIVKEGRNEENHMMFLWQLLNMESWLQAIDELD